MSNYGILKKLTKSTGALLVAGMLLTHPVAFADNTANPDKVKQLFTESVEHMRARDYDKALTCLDKAIELDSTKAALFGQRGTVYLNQQRFEEAIVDFTKAIELAPNHAQAYGLRALAYGSTGETIDAMRDLTKAIELEPANPVFYYRRAMTYEMLKGDDYALEDYNKAISLKNDDVMYFYKRCMLFMRQKKHAEAMGDINIALGFEPSNKTFLSIRAFLYTQSHDTEHAIADYEQVVKYDPADYGALDNLGVLYADKKDFATANKYFDMSLAVNDRHPEVYNGKGYIEFLQGNNDAAIALYQKALECNNEFSDAYYNLAQCYEVAKDDAKLLEAYEKFLRYAAYNDYDRVEQAQKRVAELSR